MMKTELWQFLTPEGDLSPEYPLQLPDDLVVKAYKTMWTTRLFDERMITLQRQGAISFSLSSFGEEACAVGSAAALEMCDWMYPQYREAGVMFWRGFSIQAFMDHMFGNVNDLTLGRQMPNHFGSRELNVVTVSSPIATKIPHAAGSAYAMKLLKEKSCTIAYFGEGATSEGDFHAGLNFAAVRKTPTIFFCRNNGYAISTPSFRQYACESIASKGVGYGIEAAMIDGNDFFAVYLATHEARKHTLEGEGPKLIEAITYRMGAHSTSDDPSAYRKAESTEEWVDKCPLLRLRLYLEKKGIWDKDQEREHIESVKKEIDEAIKKAKDTAQVPHQRMIEHVFHEIPKRLQEEFDDLCLS